MPRVVTKNSAFRNKHAPRMMAALINNDRQWWRIGEDGLKEVAALACDLTDALWKELSRRWDAELKGAQPPRPEPSATPRGFVD